VYALQNVGKRNKFETSLWTKELSILLDEVVLVWVRSTTIKRELDPVPVVTVKYGGIKWRFQRFKLV